MLGAVSLFPGSFACCSDRASPLAAMDLNVELPSGGEEVELPPDPDSGDSEVEPPSGSSQEYVELPQSATCCQRGCAFAIQQESADILKEFAFMKATLPREAFTKVVWEVMVETRRRFGPGVLAIRGRVVCMKSWLEAVGISRSRMDRLLQWLEAGHVDPPVDMRHSKGGPPANARLKADSMLQWVWEHLAEPMVVVKTGPEASDADPDFDFTGAVPAELRVNDSLTEWVAGPGASTTVTQAQTEVRWLQPMPLVNLYNLAISFDTDETDTEVSYSTFLRCWHDKWCSTLKFRSETQHSKCTECEKSKRTGSLRQIFRMHEPWLIGTKLIWHLCTRTVVCIVVGVTVGLHLWM